MAQEVVIQSDEDLQRMIELEAWYDNEEESSVTVVEAEPDPNLSYTNRNEVWALNQALTGACNLQPRYSTCTLGLISLSQNSILFHKLNSTL